MRESVSLLFDAGRQCWRVRFRSVDHITLKRKDTTLNVPPETFLSAGLDPFVESREHERIGWTWASEEKVRRESRDVQMSSRAKMSLAAIYTLYANRNSNEVVEATKKKNANEARHLIDFFDGELERSPDQIDMGAATDYRNFRRLEEKAAPRTVGGELTFLKQLLMWATDNRFDTGIETIHLHRLPRVLKPGEPVGTALSEDQLLSLLQQQARNNREMVHRILVVGATTMLRRSTLLGLRWEWIDISRKWLHIPAAFMKGRAGLKRPLSVPISDWTIDALGKKGRDEFVFTRQWGGHKGRPTGIDGSLAMMTKAAGLPIITLHDLRYTGNTILAGRGVPEIVRAKLMGHVADARLLDEPEDATMTMTRRYTLVTVPMLREGVAAWEVVRGDKFGDIEPVRRSRPIRI